LALKWRNGHREQTVAVASMGILSFLLYSWYNQAAGGDIRFVFPVAATLLPFSAIGVMSLYGSVRRKFEVAPNPRILVVAIVSLGALLNGILERSAWAVNPRQLWHVPAEWQETGRWIREHMKEDEFLLNNWSFFSLWDCCRDRRKNYPFNVPAEVLKDYVSKSGIKYILVDQSLVRSDPFKEKYGAFDEYGPATFLGWPRCYHDKQKPSFFSIYSEGCR
jgi:hypothetical protein